jgi:hypothetical protein
MAKPLILHEIFFWCNLTPFMEGDHVKGANSIVLMQIFSIYLNTLKKGG